VPKNIKKSDRPPSPCGLHSLMTLDAVQPGSLIPAPSISIKAGSVQQRKQEPTTHTQALNRLDALGMLERFFTLCGKGTRATILTLSNCMNLCFEPFSQISSVKDKEECKELRSVERGHSR